MRFILSNIFKKDQNFIVNFETINTISATAHNQNHDNIKALLEDNSPLFIKEHFSYYDMPYNNYDKVIYIYRDGFDTLLSYWHFRNAQSPNKYKNIDQFSNYYWNGYGTWGEHIYSWTEDKETLKKCSVYAISYEELMSDPVRILDNCLKRLGYKVSLERIVNAINLSSKDKMKRMIRSDSFMKSKDKDFHFVRSGKVNEGKILNKSIKNTFMSDQYSYDMMLKYGYIEQNNDWDKVKKSYNIQRIELIKNIFYNLKYKLLNLTR